MGILNKIFGDSHKKNKKNKKNSPDNVGVPYNKDLISTLKKDHKNLLDISEQIVKATNGKKYKLIKKYLKNFKIEFEIHSYSEKIQLYLYLKNYYKHKDEYNYIENMSNSAEKINKTTLDFLKKYISTDINNENLELFYSEFVSIIKNIQSRINVEESEIYPLYKK